MGFQSWYGSNSKNNCYKCTKRHRNCHQNCETYKKYRQEIDKIKANKEFENKTKAYPSSYYFGK